MKNNIDMKTNTAYKSPEIQVIEMEVEGSVLAASSADVGVKDWEDVEIC